MTAFCETEEQTGTPEIISAYDIILETLTAAVTLNTMLDELRCSQAPDICPLHEASVDAWCKCALATDAFIDAQGQTSSAHQLVAAAKSLQIILSDTDADHQTLFAQFCKTMMQFNLTASGTKAYQLLEATLPLMQEVVRVQAAFVPVAALHSPSVIQANFSLRHSRAMP